MGRDFALYSKLNDLNKQQHRFSHITAKPERRFCFVPFYRYIRQPFVNIKQLCIDAIKLNSDKKETLILRNILTRDNAKLTFDLPSAVKWNDIAHFVTKIQVNTGYTAVWEVNWKEQCWTHQTPSYRSTRSVAPRRFQASNDFVIHVFIYIILGTAVSLTINNTSINFRFSKVKQDIVAVGSRVIETPQKQSLTKPFQDTCKQCITIKLNLT